MSTRASSSTRMTTPRTPIPHHIDSITKKTKYIDPAHRECVPNFQAASFTPKLKRERYHGRTHNCITTFKMTTGDLFAVPHPQILSGFKAPNAYGHTPLFDGITTNAYFNGQVQKVGEYQGRKKLVPYKPNATRNISHDSRSIQVGLSCFDRRNASYIRLISGNARHFKTPLSTHQGYFVHHRPEVGTTNPGTFARKCKWAHKVQQCAAE